MPCHETPTLPVHCRRGGGGSGDVPALRWYPLGTLHPPGAGVLSASADTSVTPNISDSVMGRQPRTNVGYIDARQCGGYVLSKYGSASTRAIHAASCGPIASEIARSGFFFCCIRSARAMIG